MLLLSFRVVAHGHGAPPGPVTEIQVDKRNRVLGQTHLQSTISSPPHGKKVFYFNFGHLFSI